MTPHPLSTCLSLLPVAAALALAATASARSEWKDPTGNTFSANPAEVVGPLALFDNGARLPLKTMSDEDMVRFYRALQDTPAPARAADWAKSKSAISAEIYGRLMRYSGHDLVQDEEKGRPEPEFFIVFFTTGDRNKSWNELGPNSAAMYAQLKKRYGDLVEGFVFGVGDTMQDQNDIEVNTHGDWLFTNFETEVQMRTLKQLIPTNLYGIVLLTRTGVPLVGPEASNDAEIKADFDKIAQILSLANPANPTFWPDEARYVKAVQPVAYANAAADPVLIGNPISAAVLKQMQIAKVDATFQVGADGMVKAVTVDPATVPDKYMAMFTDGFKKKTTFVAAVDHGKFVDGTYHYHLDAAP